MSLTLSMGGPAPSGAASRLNQIASQYTPARLLALRPAPPAPPLEAAPSGEETRSPAAWLQNLTTLRLTRPGTGTTVTSAPIRLDSPTALLIKDRLAAGDTGFAGRPELSIVLAEESRTREQVWTPASSATVTVGGKDYAVTVDAKTTTYDVLTRVVKVADSSEGILYTYTVRSERPASGDDTFGPPRVTLDRAETMPASRAMPSLAPAAGTTQKASGGSRLTEAEMVVEGLGLATMTNRQDLTRYGALTQQDPNALRNLFY